MADSTRRALPRDRRCHSRSSGHHLSECAEVARAESGSADVFHVFAFQSNEGTSDAQKHRATKEIVTIHGVIPGLLQTHAGPNISPRGKGYTLGAIMYGPKRMHDLSHTFNILHMKRSLAWLRPLIQSNTSPPAQTGLGGWQGAFLRRHACYWLWISRYFAVLVTISPPARPATQFACTVRIHGAMVEAIIPTRHFGAVVQAFPPVMLLEMDDCRVLFVGVEPNFALRATPARTLAKMAIYLHRSAFLPC
jgi:hypothetical protein